MCDVPRDLLSVVLGVRRLAGNEAVDRATVMILGAVEDVDTGDGIRLTDLAVQASLDQSTVSRHVRTLEDAGLLARAEDPQDGRACRIRLTRSGRRTIRTVWERRAHAVERVLDAWPAEDRDRFVELLHRLATDLRPLVGDRLPTTRETERLLS